SVVVVIYEHYVARLEIPVNHTFLVGVRERGGCLYEDSKKSVSLQVALFLQKLSQARPFQKVHYKIGLPIVRQSEIENSKYVRMVESACRLRLLLEALQCRGGGHQIGKEHLNSDNPLHQAMARFIHTSHAAFAQDAENLVAVGDDRADLLVLCQGCKRSVVLR